MHEIWTIFSQMRWQDLVDIILVAFVIYQLLLLVRGTRAMHVLIGLLVILALLALSRWMELMTVNWIISSFLSSLLLVLVILFAGDIRRALARLGQGAWNVSGPDSTSVVEAALRAAATLASTKTGALIVFERRIGLAEYHESAVALNGEVSQELLVQIFQTSGPLHDGPVIIGGDRIIAARCILPLSATVRLVKHLGTRHRAALGLSEETDAVCLVVSEERGWMSLAVGGELHTDLDSNELRSRLHRLMKVEKLINFNLLSRLKRLAGV